MREVVLIEFVRVSRHSRREDSRHLNDDLYDHCKGRWPQLFPAKWDCLRVEAPTSAAIVDEVIAFMRTHGREPYWKRHPSCPFEHPTLFPIEGKRVFEPEDVANAEYLAFRPEKAITMDASKDDEGNLSIKRSKVNQQLIGRAFPWEAPVCKDSLKVEMEAEGFVGLSFLPVALPGTKAAGEPVWAISADREMPALLNRMVNDDGTDHEPSENRGCHVDDFYFPSLLRFPIAHVRAMEPLDIAISKERPRNKLGSGFKPEIVRKFDPFLIASRRFRQWCEKRKLKIEWWPVVLE